MELVNKNIEINSQPKYLNDITHYVIENLLSSNIKNGLCTLFIKHTSALIIQENADPAVLRDIENFFNKLVLRMSVFTNMIVKDLMTCPHILEVSLRVLQYLFQLKTQNWFGHGKLYLYEHRNQGYHRKNLPTNYWRIILY